jgi:hypothetical protein
MGSYDTGEVSIAPRRAREPEPELTERVSTPAASAPAPAMDDRVTEAYRAGRRATSAYDPQLKTIVALGGGLTPDRIVQPLPDDVRDGNLMDVVKYLMGDQVATTSSDRAVAEAVQARMSRQDYRVIVNNTLNLGAAKMTKPLIEYLVQKTQQGEDGELKFNFADVAIVSHDEGGMKAYRMNKPLEKLL